jgi:hypothetical protein
MSKAGIDKLIANAQKHFAIDHDQQVAEWKARREWFPSTQKGDRGAVSPLGGLCKPAAETRKAPNTAPKNERWW